MCCRWCRRTGTARQVGPSRRPDRSRRSWLPSCTWLHCPAVGAGYPAGIPVLAGGAPPAPAAPVVPPLLVCRRCWWYRRSVLSRRATRATFRPPPRRDGCTHRRKFLPCLDVPPVPGLHVFHAPSPDVRGYDQIGRAAPTHRPCLCRRTGSVRSRPRNRSTCRTQSASHWPWVYCTLHFVIALTVPSASATQLVWQSVTGQSPVVCDAHMRCRPVAGSGPCRNCLMSFRLRRLRPSQQEFHCRWCRRTAGCDSTGAR